MLLVFGLLGAIIVCCCGSYVLLCHDLVYAEAVSPDGRYVAMDYLGACGPPPRYVHQVRIGDARVPRALLRDPFLLIASQVSAPVFDAQYLEILGMEWVADRTLLVEYNTGASGMPCFVYMRRESWLDAQITYRGPCEP